MRYPCENLPNEEIVQCTKLGYSHCFSKGAPLFGYSYGTWNIMDQLTTQLADSRSYDTLGDDPVLLIKEEEIEEQRREPPGSQIDAWQRGLLFRRVREQEPVHPIVISTFRSQDIWVLDRNFPKEQRESEEFGQLELPALGCSIPSAFRILFRSGVIPSVSTCLRAFDPWEVLEIFFSTPLDHYLTLGQQVVFQLLELQEMPISPQRLSSRSYQ